MNPGSLADWPMREQRPLFGLLGDTDAAIGVELMESYLMRPTKSVSAPVSSSLRRTLTLNVSLGVLLGSSSR